MESWTPDRTHRFKNILAFLIASFPQTMFFEHYLRDLAPAEIEEKFLKFLGPDLPTQCEYAHGLTKEQDSLFETYCSLYSPQEDD